jgi:predicted membrane protein
MDIMLYIAVLFLYGSLFGLIVTVIYTIWEYYPIQQQLLKYRETVKIRDNSENSFFIPSLPPDEALKLYNLMCGITIDK